MPAICEGVFLIVAIFTLPETLFSRANIDNLLRQTYMQKLFFHGKVIDKPIRLSHFFILLTMMKYAAVTLTCIIYVINLTHGSSLFAVTISYIGAVYYNFSLSQTGVFLGAPLLIRCIIGESITGWVSDRIINAYAKRNDGY